MRLITLIISITIFGFASAYANEVVRPRRANQLPVGTAVDLGYRVTTAKVVTFNRITLERDFPKLRTMNDDSLRAWILDNFAYINSHQLRLTGIRNSRVSINKNKTKNLFVPPGVGRGAVVESDLGMVDIKASGNSSWNLAQVKELSARARKTPEGLKQVREKDHSSGLEIYNLAAAEYVRQLEIQNDYDRRNLETGSNHQTVESYFLIDYGFNVIYPEGEIPAFLYGRQAHFGRLAENRHLKDEIYIDKGEFQSTYTGARIDFGGARTTSESDVPYHEQMRNLRPGDTASFIKEKTRAFVNVHPVDRIEFVSSAEARDVLSARFWDLIHAPRPAAIGRNLFDMKEEWSVDDPRIARIKWTLWELGSADRTAFLAPLGEEALSNLFHLSDRDFQMPLPEEVYRDAIKQESSAAARAAASAAVRVFDRFPNLQEPTIEFALRELKRNKNFWMPSVIEVLISNLNFKNSDAFIMRVLRIGNVQATNQIIYELSKDTSHPERSHQVLEWIRNHSEEPEIYREVRFRFPEKMAPRTCSEIFGK